MEGRSADLLYEVGWLVRSLWCLMAFSEDGFHFFDCLNFCLIFPAEPGVPDFDPQPLLCPVSLRVAVLFPIEEKAFPSLY